MSGNERVSFSNWRRIGSSPEWVQTRHRMSYAARRLIGERVTERQDAKDVLRVFARYEIRSLRDRPASSYPEWLGIVGHGEEWRRKLRLLRRLEEEVFGAGEQAR